MNEASDYPLEVNAIYQSRRDALCEGLARIGWDFPKPKGTMFVWAPIPEPYQEMGSLEFASFLVQEAEVATSPGIGFGEGGDAFVRFALIENEQRINQAVRNLRKALAQALTGRRRSAPPGCSCTDMRCEATRAAHCADDVVARNSPFTEIP